MRRRSEGKRGGSKSQKLVVYLEIIMKAFTETTDAWGWIMREDDVRGEEFGDDDVGKGESKSWSKGAVDGMIEEGKGNFGEKGCNCEKGGRNEGTPELNVLKGMTKEEMRGFKSNDDKATKEWDAFMSARRGSSSIGDVGSGVWFESLGVKNNGAALSLVMSVGLPMNRRREVWKRWAEGRQGRAAGGGAGAEALDDTEAAAGAKLCISEWKRFELKASECCEKAKEMARKEKERKEEEQEPWSLQLSKATMHTIDVDLKRTMNTHPHFCPGGKGLESLKKILVACALADEKISYLQGMNFLAAFLMLTFMASSESGSAKEQVDNSLEEDVFKMIRMLTGGVLKGYYAPGLPTLLGDTSVLTQLMKKTDPQFHEHLSNMGFDLTLVCPQWFIACFITSMKAEWAARVWDLILFANAATGGGGGVMVWLGMSIMNATRGKLMGTDSMCRVITESE